MRNVCKTSALDLSLAASVDNLSTFRLECPSMSSTEVDEAVTYPIETAVVISSPYKTGGSLLVDHSLGFGIHDFIYTATGIKRASW
jgi:hypothetical protein